MKITAVIYRIEYYLLCEAPQTLKTWGGGDLAPSRQLCLLVHSCLSTTCAVGTWLGQALKFHPVSSVWLNQHYVTLDYIFFIKALFHFNYFCRTVAFITCKMLFKCCCQQERWHHQPTECVPKPQNVNFCLIFVVYSVNCKQQGPLCKNLLQDSAKWYHFQKITFQHSKASSVEMLQPPRIS